MKATVGWRILSVCATILPLASCVSAYEPIVASPVPLEMAQARCEMMSTSTQQGYFAMGSQSYVAGAALGNAAMLFARTSSSASA